MRHEETCQKLPLPVPRLGRPAFRTLKRYVCVVSDAVCGGLSPQPGHQCHLACHTAVRDTVRKAPNPARVRKIIQVMP